jgi:hypothetical protein
MFAACSSTISEMFFSTSDGCSSFAFFDALFLFAGFLSTVFFFLAFFLIIANTRIPLDFIIPKKQKARPGARPLLEIFFFSYSLYPE